MQKMLKNTARGLIDQLMTILSLLNSRMVIISLLWQDVCRVSLQIGEAPGRGKESYVYIQSKKDRTYFGLKLQDQRICTIQSISLLFIAETEHLISATVCGFKGACSEIRESLKKTICGSPSQHEHFQIPARLGAIYRVEYPSA